MTLGNGTTTTLDYDNQSALSGLSHAFVGGTGNVGFSFTRNQAGEIVGHSWNNDRYLWTATHLNQTYAANGLNQYTAVGSRTLTYDARANLTGDGPWTYTYDSDNRLRTARSTQLNATLDYDPIGRLRQTTFNAEWALIYNGSMDIPIVVPLSTPVTRTTRLLYDGSDLIAEYDGAAPDTVQRRHVHGPGIDEPLVTYAGSGTGNKTWLYSDHQGSVIAQAGASGANTAIDAYGPFGETDPAAGTRFGYTGQRYLAPLGLYDYKARFYSPTLGRFLQTDPIGYRDDNNLYAYVGNNPVNRRDPWGLSRQEAALLASCTMCDRPWQTLSDFGNGFIGNPGQGTAHEVGVGTRIAVDTALIVIDVLDSPFSPGPDVGIIGAAGFAQRAGKGVGAAVQDSEKALPALQRIHSSETLTTGSAKYGTESVRKMSTEDIVKSLKPGSAEPLKVKPDGRIFDGNTRVFILEQRGYDVNTLPRVIVP